MEAPQKAVWVKPALVGITDIIERGETAISATLAIVEDMKALRDQLSALIAAEAEHAELPVNEEDAHAETAVLRAACAAHEVNRVFCTTLGDYSQPLWEDAPKWQKDSAVAGARAVLNNPKTTPEESHGRWLEQKFRDGWVYGEKKDVEKKTHPCMRPYHELPFEQRQKDHLFLTTVLSILIAEGVVLP